MTDGGSGGEGPNGLGGVRPQAESMVSDARRSQRHVPAGRWPGAGTVVRVIVLALVALVLLGWVLSALSR